jgi:hypothetical protein
VPAAELARVRGLGDPDRPHAAGLALGALGGCDRRPPRVGHEPFDPDRAQSSSAMCGATGASSLSSTRSAYTVASRSSGVARGEPTRDSKSSIRSNSVIRFRVARCMSSRS